MSEQNLIPKEKRQAELDEARLQYEKMYYEHNKEVTDLFEIKLENAINEAKMIGKSFSHQQYLKLVKDFWKKLYVYDAF